MCILQSLSIPLNTLIPVRRPLFLLKNRSYICPGPIYLILAHQFRSGYVPNSRRNHDEYAQNPLRACLSSSSGSAGWHRPSSVLASSGTSSPCLSLGSITLLVQCCRLNAATFDLSSRYRLCKRYLSTLSLYASTYHYSRRLPLDLSVRFIGDL